jgi:hypothetical protein
MRLFALRGAVSVDRNDAKDILEATTTLMETIMERNALTPETVVSCIFTATNDLNAEFPAVAARAVGFDGVRVSRRGQRLAHRPAGSPIGRGDAPIAKRPAPLPERLSRHGTIER